MVGVCLNKRREQHKYSRVKEDRKGKDDMTSHKAKGVKGTVQGLE